MHTITAPDNKHRHWMPRGIAAVVICVAADTWPHAMATATARHDAAQGVIDASNKVEAVAAACPRTKIVLGGYSQGAAVALFGKPYSAKTIELCAPGDPVCGGGLRRAAHSAYKSNEMAEQAADVTARALSSSPI